MSLLVRYFLENYSAFKLKGNESDCQNVCLESTCLEDKEGENEKKILEITQENKEEKWDNKSDKLEQTIIEQVTGEKKGGKDKWRSKRNCKSSWWIFE